MKYELNVEMVFSGTVTVVADNIYKAMEIAERNMRASGPQITDCGCDNIVDYDINLHADTFVNQ